MKFFILTRQFSNIEVYKKAVINSFLTGCFSSDINIQRECANAIAYLVMYHFVYESVPYDKANMSTKDTKQMMDQILQSEP